MCDARAKLLFWLLNLLLLWRSRCRRRRRILRSLITFSNTFDSEVNIGRFYTRGRIIRPEE